MTDLKDPGARHALRLATAAAHERLHHLPDFAVLARGEITRPAYIAVLQRQLAFHTALERQIAGAPSLRPWGIDAQERRRTPMLRADLAALGATPQEMGMPSLPPAGSAAQALGSLYVSEGSTLGGRELSRRLDHLLPPGTPGRAFLLGYGEQHGAMWRSFCAALEACGADPGRRAEMTAAALATFAAFEAWFNPAPEPAATSTV
ncbi:bacteriophytochrome heme oxygenase BphO [Rhodovastum atsumiense]|uniref:Biliverdin-producing heme oxygenase n=1 Tax=Rhodovastum atsumiense TaxID=504468 RepID=A0A5M6IX42_9PROT|nr:biliverdin-producing heme oxygenase [Rhodovastum atsumiense]KAA5612862.1 biliverdin-producing heme oxygenase [Rhodovastum atsumiense]CAH2601068.1 bacteriophytochrome heme oxygenase BphO [Rhodovastum atsumiense]